MSRYVIVGSGQVGTTTARALAARGDTVRVVTRSGSGPSLPGVELVALDATDGAALAEACAGATALFNCANPPYDSWPTAWPPLAAGMLTAAERSGARLVITGNLYGYGPVTGPMTESTPLAARTVKGRVRVGMWEDALAAHRAGRVRATEVRASDFFGPEVLLSHVGERFVPAVLAGKRVYMVGDVRAAHSWTYVPDLTAAMIRVADDDDACGRAWHAPTVPAMSSSDLADRLAAAAGARPARLRSIPGPVLTAAGVLSPFMREMRLMTYQFEAPFILDSSESERLLGLSATPLETQLAATTAFWRGR